MKDLSSNNPLFLWVVHQMKKEFPLLTNLGLKTGLLTMNISTLSIASTYQKYPTMTWSMLSIASLKESMKTTCKQLFSFQRITGGWAFPPTSGSSSLDEWFARRTRCLSILPSYRHSSCLQGVSPISESLYGSYHGPFFHQWLQLCDGYGQPWP